MPGHEPRQARDAGPVRRACPQGHPLPYRGGRARAEQHPARFQQIDRHRRIGGSATAERLLSTIVLTKMPSNEVTMTTLSFSVLMGPSALALNQQTSISFRPRSFVSA